MSKHLPLLLMYLTCKIFTFRKKFRWENISSRNTYNFPLEYLEFQTVKKTYRNFNGISFILQYNFGNVIDNSNFIKESPQYLSPYTDLSWNMHFIKFPYEVKRIKLQWTSLPEIFKKDKETYNLTKKLKYLNRVNDLILK